MSKKKTTYQEKVKKAFEEMGGMGELNFLVSHLKDALEKDLTAVQDRLLRLQAFGPSSIDYVRFKGDRRTVEEEVESVEARVKRYLRALRFTEAFRDLLMFAGAETFAETFWAQRRGPAKTPTKRG